MRESTLMDTTLPRLMSSYAVLVIALLWIGIVVALLTDRAWLDQVWDWVAALPLLVRMIVWLVFLPLLTGLWIWKSGWSTPVTLLAAAGMLMWTYAAISSFVKAWFVSTG